MNTLNDIHQNRPPREAATDPESAVYAWPGVLTSIWSVYPAVPEGRCWLELAAVGGDVAVMFKRVSEATSVTTTTGVNIVSGTRVRFYVDPAIDLYIDAAGAGSLTLRRVGHICERSRQ